MRLLYRRHTKPVSLEMRSGEFDLLARHTVSNPHKTAPQGTGEVGHGGGGEEPHSVIQLRLHRLQFLKEGVVLLKPFGIFGDLGVSRANDDHHGKLMVQISLKPALHGVDLFLGVCPHHQAGHTELLIQALDHVLRRDGLILPPDEITVYVKIHIIQALHVGQGLVHVKVIHVEGVLGKLHARISEDLGAEIHGVHHEDLALILDKMGIAVRSGQMCAEPLMDRFGVTGMLRVSLAPYNTMQEAEYFIKCLDKAIGMLM